MITLLGKTRYSSVYVWHFSKEVSSTDVDVEYRFLAEP
ncbi:MULTISPECIES: DUF2627 domain-containing protein [unclassified Erwinia]|nr:MULTISPECIES: DUF2627 domain-containing protein [unclassified Erwinia]